MNGKSARLIALVCALVLASCGTVATPVQQATEAGAATTVTVQPTEVVAEPTATTTTVPPTATTVPPTATAVPPTATTAPTKAPATATTAPTAASAAAAEGDPKVGEKLFTAGENGGIPCSTCHHVDSTDPLVGPGLAGIGERAADRVPGENAIEYLHQSIVAPDAHVVEGFPAGVMPHNYAEVYSEEEISDLIAYLLSL